MEIIVAKWLASGTDNDAHECQLGYQNFIKLNLL